MYDEIQIKLPENDNQLFFVRQEPINIDNFDFMVAQDEGIDLFKYQSNFHYDLSTKEFNKKLNKEKSTSQIDFSLGEFLNHFDDRFAI